VLLNFSRPPRSYGRDDNSSRSINGSIWLSYPKSEMHWGQPLARKVNGVWTLALRRARRIWPKIHRTDYLLVSGRLGYARIDVGLHFDGGGGADPAYEVATSSAAKAACATMTSCSILAPPAATAPMTWPATVIGKPPGTLVKSPMRTAMLSAFSSGA
jgi:hypothetical protein